MGTYENYQSRVVPPGWLQAPYGLILNRTLGALKDVVTDAAKQAIKSRFVTLAPVDALPWIGQERGLERYLPDTDASYRARLANAWATWLLAGTPAGIIAALNTAGFPNVHIYNNATLPPGYGAWPPDGDTANWSRFWVFIDPPYAFPWVLRRWGDGGLYGLLTSVPPGSGTTWGSTATPDQVAMVRRIIKKWKSSHEICTGIYINFPTDAVTLHWLGVS